MKFRYIAFVFTLAFGSMAMAQAAAPQNPSTNAPAQGKWHGKRGGQKLAKELGLSADQEAQIKSIRQDERSQAQAIKNDTSLTPDQKREKLKELRQADQQKFEGVLTPDQRTKFQQIREERKEHRGKGRGHGRGRGRGQGAGAPANPNGPGF